MNTHMTIHEQLPECKVLDRATTGLPPTNTASIPPFFLDLVQITNGSCKMAQGSKPTQNLKEARDVNLAA